MAPNAAEGYITDVAYIPGFYGNMAPVALRYAAALNRVVPPATASGFRYLELGCGLGRSLTTLAAACPQGEFVGVDINPEHTAIVEREISAGGLGNARVVTAGFGALPHDVGQFEFIALHGVFSWVSPAVREEIFAVARERLAPGGLLLVSYNAMPGWAHLQPIRGIMRQYAALRAGDSTQRVRDALAYLVFIRDKHAKYFDDNPRAAAYVDGLLKQDIRYLAHEYLNEHWTSFYFSEVASLFAGCGLTFAGSLPVYTNFWDLCVRPEFQELFRTTTNRLITEAHKDFCANTAFRWDIYCKGPRVMETPADRVREADDIFFRVARPGITLPHKANLGVVTSTVQGPVYQSLLDLLAGRSMRLSEILAATEFKGMPPTDIARAVDAGVAMGLFDIAAGPVTEPTFDTSRPIAVPNQFNRMVLKADSLGGRPIALASENTGTGHTLNDLEAAILDEFASGGVDGAASRVDTRLAGSGRNLQQNGAPVTDPATRARIIAETCAAFAESSLPQLAKLGIIANA